MVFASLPVSVDSSLAFALGGISREIMSLSYSVMQGSLALLGSRISTHSPCKILLSSLLFFLLALLGLRADKISLALPLKCR